MPGSSTRASNTGDISDDGLKKMCSTPAALSCATNNAPPVPCISRIHDGGGAAVCSSAGGRNGARERAIALAAVALIPTAPRPDRSCRLEIPRSKYCLIRRFMGASPASLPWLRMATIVRFWALFGECARPDARPMFLDAFAPACYRDNCKLGALHPQCAAPAVEAVSRLWA